MNIIPVLDLLHGITVQAVGGRRDEYGPLRSHLTDSVDPSIVLTSLESVCRSGVAYIADLDSILRGELNRCTLAELCQHDVRLMVDSGIRSCRDVEELFDLGIDHAVLGLESLPDAATAEEILSLSGPESLILSIDLQAGRPLSCNPAWKNLPPSRLLAELTQLGFRRWIVLDLAAVGTSAGVITQDVCRQLRGLRPHDEIITGGGIRSAEDLRDLNDGDVDGVLVASALHNGSITASDLDRL